MIARCDLNRKPITQTLLGAGTVVVGDVLFSGGLRVDGEVRGNIRCIDSRLATLVIGEKGRVDGDMEVTNIVIHGSATGRVFAKELLELRSTAHVSCDVEYSAIEMHLGAVVHGPLLHQPNGVHEDEVRSATALRRGGR